MPRLHGMLVSLQVVGADTGDSTPSVVLNVDSKRYLFNCGEGTQRMFSELRVCGGRVQYENYLGNSIAKAK